MDIDELFELGSHLQDFLVCVVYVCVCFCVFVSVCVYANISKSKIITQHLHTLGSKHFRYTLC